MSDDPHIAAIPVPEGSIVWLHNIDLPDDDELDTDDMPNQLTEQLRRALGHDRFVVLCTQGPNATVHVVLGPDELVAAVRAALTEPATIKVCNSCGCAVDDVFVQKRQFGAVVATTVKPCGHLGGYRERPLMEAIGACEQCERPVFSAAMLYVSDGHPRPTKELSICAGEYVPIGVFAGVEVRTCRICGCDDDHACEGGCSWVESDLCLACWVPACPQCSRTANVHPVGGDGVGDYFTCLACDFPFQPMGSEAFIMGQPKEIKPDA